MAREASKKVSIKVDVLESTTPLTPGSGYAHMRHTIVYDKELTNGTVDGSNINRVVSLAFNATTTPTTFDLSGSVPSNLDSGNTVVLVEITGIYVNNLGTSGNIHVGAAANHVPVFLGTVASSGIRIGPGGNFSWTDPVGVAITGGTGDIFNVVASAGTIPYEIIITGRSA